MDQINILVTDDEREIADLLEIYLVSDGYRVWKAYSAKEGLQILQEHDIQLAILDIMMPEMDGITALAKLRQVSNVPVILLTAKSEDTDKILGLNVGADDYITKALQPGGGGWPGSAASCGGTSSWGAVHSGRRC